VSKFIEEAVSFSSLRSTYKIFHTFLIITVHKKTIIKQHKEELYPKLPHALNEDWPTTTPTADESVAEAGHEVN
jgi:hypothetical protein